MFRIVLPRETTSIKTVIGPYQIVSIFSGIAAGTHGEMGQKARVDEQKKHFLDNIKVVEYKRLTHAFLTCSMYTHEHCYTFD